MLRLTVAPAGSASPTIVAEGRLVGEWVALLEAESRNVLRRAGAVVLDLAAVSDIDSHGVGVLRQLRQEAVVLRGLSPLMLALLSEEAIQ